MRRTTLLTPLLVALALAVPAAADATCYTTSETSDEMVVVFVPHGGHTGITPGSGTYVANDVCQDDEPPEDPYGDGPCLFSVWLYDETNGIPGLQRGDEVRDDVAACGWTVDSDTLTFF